MDLQLHLRRSRCIDAFVAIEREITVLQARLCPGHETELLSQKIGRLRAIPASPKFSRKQRTVLHEILPKVEEIVPLRHDLVHGSLSVLIASDITVAAFVNVREAIKIGTTARLFTCDSLDELAARALSLAAKLAAALDKEPAPPVPKADQPPVSN